ncbi:myeloid cell surface antigen CD33-like [Trichosurus vulpecula]|uniref:myeloid cell surface antigen CD33-like n=1 Tax=Trichosurus vulpecula TaxID=9337 RepID=UPI00186AE376|nr:myeloid cell surface antigen CD33-like [Trichosurus vulpecula]
MELLLLLLLLLQFGEGSFSQQKQEFGIHIQKRVTVQEWLCVSIPCSFYYPPKYKNNDTGHGYWYHREFLNTPVATNDPQKAVESWAKGRFYFIGNPQMDDCSLRITGAKKRDQGVYEFRIEKGNLTYSYTNDRVFIQVENLTQKPEIHMPEILEPSQMVTLTCVAPGACRNETPITFFWNGTALSSQRLASPNTSFSKLLFTPQPQDDGTNLTCWVTFPKATVSTGRTVQLRVADRGPPSSSLFLETVMQGALVVFILVAVLFICLVICLVKMMRRKQPEGDAGASVSSTNQLSNGIPLDQHENSVQHTSSEIPPQVVLTPCSQDKEDQVQYASISFQAQKPQKICKSEGTNTEYSDLKFQ